MYVQLLCDGEKCVLLIVCMETSFCEIQSHVHFIYSSSFIDNSYKILVLDKSLYVCGKQKYICTLTMCMCMYIYVHRIIGESNIWQFSLKYNWQDF